MIRRPPRSTRTDTPFPYTTLFRSHYCKCESLSTTGQRRARCIRLPAAKLIQVNAGCGCCRQDRGSLPLERRSEEHTSELQSLMRISYAVFCLNKKNIDEVTNQKNL